MFLLFCFGIVRHNKRIVLFMMYNLQRLLFDNIWKQIYPLSQYNGNGGNHILVYQPSIVQLPDDCPPPISQISFPSIAFRFLTNATGSSVTNSTSGICGLVLSRVNT